MSSPTSRKFILILSSHLRLGLLVCCTEGSVRFRGFCNWFVTWLSFYDEELLAPRPTPKLGYHSLSAVRDCLFNTFAAALYIRKPFLHPQPEDAPCRDDKDPLITVTGTHLSRTYLLCTYKIGNYVQKLITF